MSIIIKDMKMPKDGVYWCEIGVAGDIATITIHGEDRKSFHLVPVQPHGRLGDLDELYASLKKWLIQNRHSMTEATRVWIRGVLEGIAAAPTIIPAEEGE